QSLNAAAATFRAVLDSIEVVDPSTVRIKTRGRQASFPGLLAIRAGIVSPNALKQFGKDVDTRVVGTGPFKIDQFVPNESLTLVRNDNYWGQKPLLDRIVVRGITEPTARTAALVTGQTDIAMFL